MADEIITQLKMMLTVAKSKNICATHLFPHPKLYQIKSVSRVHFASEKLIL